LSVRGVCWHLIFLVFLGWHPTVVFLGTGRGANILFIYYFFFFCIFFIIIFFAYKTTKINKNQNSKKKNGKKAWVTQEALF